jgi:hypothetical protein
VTVIKNLSRYLPYFLCPLAFFALLGSIQYLILRQAFIADSLPPAKSVQGPVAAPKGSRVPASFILP